MSLTAHWYCAKVMAYSTCDRCIMVITSAFQAEYAGSIPVGRLWYDERMVMGKRGELFSVRFSAKNKSRTYFLNLKENRKGDLFLNLVESKPQNGATSFERYQIVLFEDDLKEFQNSFQQIMDFIQNHSPGEKIDDEDWSNQID